MPNTLLQILDDNHGEFKYGAAGNWTLNRQAAWYQGTTTYPEFSSSGTALYGTFVLSFEGTSIAFTGNTPDAALSQTATVTIDNGTPYNITYPGTSQTYVQWYQSPTLAEGTHTIVMEHIDGTAVDYALLEVGQNTPLSGKTLVIDNDDRSVQYSGQWQRNTGQFDPGNLPNGFPLRNSTHRSSHTGDSFPFGFIGTSIAIYGIVNWQELGMLSATYTLDGTPLTQSYSFSTSTSEYMSQDKERANFLYFSLDDLAAGNHTLSVNITECQNSQYAFDFATYAPSFSTVADMSPAPLNLAPSATTSNIAPSTSANSSSSRSVSSPSRLSKTEVGFIAGGVVGGTVFLILFTLSLFLTQRRRLLARASSNRPHAETTPFPFRGPVGAAFLASRSNFLADLKSSRAGHSTGFNNTESSRIHGTSPHTSYVQTDAEPPAYDDTSAPDHDMNIIHIR